MRELTEKQWQDVLVILRLYTRARADTRLLSAMLLKHQSDQTLVEDWYGELRKLQQLPAYAAQIEETEQLIAQADALKPDTALIELISKLHPPDFHN
jgi:hypothetical protein